jgi:1,2-diacylglycerol-3-alpha-glucose alpha-1,2-galactosyltransferase
LSEKQKKETKEKYHIPIDQKVILSVGQIQHRKGVLDFIEVAKQMPEYLFIWCGGFSFKKITDGYKELQDIVDNPPSNVRFLGIVPREDINAIYNIADILFMPSYNELFPMAILEAVNSGVPLVLRDLDLYKNILFNKYFAAKNNNEFVKGIKDILTHKKTYKKYSDFSKEISEHYSKEVVYQQWEEFYLNIYDKYQKKLK